MKASVILLLVLFCFTACQKEAKVTPDAVPVTPTQTQSQTPVQTAVPTVNPDTIPEKAAFKIKLAKDNSNDDETMFLFKKAANTAYNFDEDATYFAGFGQVSLSSISSDGQDLAINTLPYKSGMSVGLNVNAKADGAYSLKLSYEKNIPANIQVWLKDTYLKDSVDVRTTVYNFSVVKADTSSFGSKRFKLIIKSGPSQTATSH